MANRTAGATYRPALFRSRWMIFAFAIISLLALVFLTPTIAEAQTSTTGKLRADQEQSAADETVLDCGYGVSMTIIVPPPDFNALEADPQDLEAYGYPPRPDAEDTDELKTWTTYVTSPIERRSTCPTIEKSDPSKGETPKIGRVATINWCGWTAKQRIYTEADGHIKVPHITGQAGIASHATSWVGIGQGTSPSSPLVQSGVDGDWDGSAVSYNTWWEEVAATAITPGFDYQGNNLLTAHAGDDLYSHVSLSTSGVAKFHLVNETTGVDSGTFQKTISGAYPDGTAEWIVERPQISGVWSKLAHFTQLVFSEDRAYGDGAWRNVGNETNSPSTLTKVSDNSVVLAAHNSIQGTNLFSPTWMLYGP